MTHPTVRYLLFSVLLVWPAYVLGQSNAQSDPIVCAELRPNWTPSDGIVTMWGELLIYLTNPLFLALAVLAMLTMWRDLRRFAWILAFCFAVLAYLETPFFWAGAPWAEIAQEEGCIGPRTLSLGLNIAISALMIFIAVRPKRAANTQE